MLRLVQGQGVHMFTEPVTGDTARLKTRRRLVSRWLFELLFVAGLVAVALHFGELRRFVMLLKGLRPQWLLAAAVLQAGTYVCSASVWRLALAHERCSCPLGTLVRITFVTIAADQAVPSAGLSGAVAAIRALTRRQVPPNIVVAALFVGLVTGYAAYSVAVVTSIVLLRGVYSVSLRILMGSGVFLVVAVAVPAAIIVYRDALSPRFRRTLMRIPAVSAAIDAVTTAPIGMLRDQALWRRALPLNWGEILLDCATLLVVLTAIGVEVSATAVFGSFVLASAVSEAAPLPATVGTFEATAVTMLHLVGVPVEAGLTAAVLLRGITLWLPVLAGLWFARRELSPHVEHTSLAR